MTTVRQKAPPPAAAVHNVKPLQQKDSDSSCFAALAILSVQLKGPFKKKKKAQQEDVALVFPSTGASQL